MEVSILSPWLSLTLPFSVCGWKRQICHFPNKKRMKGAQRACCSHIKPHDVTLPHTHVLLAVRPSHTISLTRCQAARRNHPCRAGVRKCVIPEIICCRWMISCCSIRHGVKNQIFNGRFDVFVGSEVFFISCFTENKQLLRFLSLCEIGLIRLSVFITGENTLEKYRCRKSTALSERRFWWLI